MTESGRKEMAHGSFAYSTDIPRSLGAPGWSVDCEIVYALNEPQETLYIYHKTTVTTFSGTRNKDSGLLWPSLEKVTEEDLLRSTPPK